MICSCSTCKNGVLLFIAVQVMLISGCDVVMSDPSLLFMQHT